MTCSCKSRRACFPGIVSRRDNALQTLLTRCQINLIFTVLFLCEGEAQKKRRPKENVRPAPTFCVGLSLVLRATEMEDRLFIMDTRDPKARIGPAGRYRSNWSVGCLNLSHDDGGLELQSSTPASIEIQERCSAFQ